jgi:ligand-binding sensor domain-containing protein
MDRIRLAPTSTRLVLVLAACLALFAAPAAAHEWKLLRPSNTGIPGEEIRFLDYDAGGKLWVGARWIFFEEGGLGIYDRTSQVWTNYADWQTPIPTEFVNDVAFGPGGVVWIATDKGLVKKAGDTWTVYTHLNSPLLHDRIRQIDLDSQGHVWINNTDFSSQNAALFEFTGTTWRKWAVPEIPWADPWRSLDGVVVDHADHVWVGNMTLPGVAEWDGSRWTLHGSAMDVLVPAAVDADNGIWVIEGHLGYVIHRWNGHAFVPWGGTAPPLPTTTNTVVKIDGGTIYIGNWTGQVVRTSNGGASWTPYVDIGARIVGITCDPLSPDVWIATPGNVHHFDVAGAWKKSLNAFNTGMPDWFVDRFNADRDGNFWLATGEGGISRFDGLRWRNWGAHNKGLEPYPFGANEPMGCAYHSTDGMIWMGGNGIARWDPATGVFTGFWNWENNPGIDTQLFTFITQDKNGVLMAAQQSGGVFRFDGTRWARDTAVNAVVPSGELPGMARDSHGDVWLADRFALHRWDGTTWTTVGDDWGLTDLGGVNALAIGPDDAIWLGTEGGLLRWRGGTLTRFTTANSPLPTDAIKGIAVRADGLLAVAASKFQSVTPFPCGLAIVSGDPAVAAHWTVYAWGTSPLPHYQLGAVAFDPRGDLWLSATSAGVAIVRTGSTPVSVDPPAASSLSLRLAGPNPFRAGAGTSLDFVLPSAGRVASVDIFDVAGRRVRTLTGGPQAADRGRVHWDGAGGNGESLPAGIYLARLATGDGVRTLKLVLVE